MILVVPVLEFRLLLRDWKGGQLGIIAAALVLAVAVVASVAILAERVQYGLLREVSTFLAADILLSSGVGIPEEYFDKAEEYALKTARIAEFDSMVFHADSNHLASVKAVSALYPLRGKLTISMQAFAPDGSDWQVVSAGPARGEAWVEERLLPMIDVEIGGWIEVGSLPLKVTRIIVDEPDRGGGFSVMGARLMMNTGDLEATGVIQPGSRVRFSLLAAGSAESVGEYKSWAESRADEHLNIVMPEEAEEQLSDALARGRSFLLLSGTVGVLLAAIALALSSHRYAERHKDNIALMKSWGLPSRRIREILIKQLGLLGFICTSVGLIVGSIVHHLLLWSISDLLPQGLPAAGLTPYITAAMTGFLCLPGFSLPAMWHLPAIAPLRVLRRDMDTDALSVGKRLSIGLALLVVILFWYSGSVVMTFAFLAGAVVVAMVLGGMALALMTLFKAWAARAGSLWRLSIGNLWRRKWQSIVQMIAFSLTIMLLLVMISVRTSLLDEWQTQLPEDMPNHFLVNVAPWQVDQVKEMMAGNGLETESWYPMVRGRLIARNGRQLTDEQMERAGGLNREVNLTWSMDLSSSNRIVAGEWWRQPGRSEFSMEEDVAGQLGAELGDMFTFSLGGIELEAELTSLRAVSWDSMQPNFYIMFPEAVIENYSPNWITSAHLKPGDKMFINDLLKAHPTILVIALDEIINRVRLVVNRVSTGLELMLLMILACGVLVLFAAISSSFDERAQESAVLRTLGSSRNLILGVLCIEFGFMGFMAGLVGALGAQLAILALQHLVFNMEPSWYLWIWLSGPIAGSLLVASMGLLRSYPLVVTPPLQSLRALD